MKQILIMACILALSLPLGLAGCSRTEVKSLQEELAKTRKEKETVEAKMYVVTQARDELQQQVKDLTESRDQLQSKVAELDTLRKQVAELDPLRKRVDEDNKTIAALKEQIQELTQSRDTAAAEAESAKLRIDELAQKLGAETQKVSILQKQLKQVQAAIAELQNSIKL